MEHHITPRPLINPLHGPRHTILSLVARGNSGRVSPSASDQPHPHKCVQEKAHPRALALAVSVEAGIMTVHDPVNEHALTNESDKRAKRTFLTSAQRDAGTQGGATQTTDGQITLLDNGLGGQAHCLPIADKPHMATSAGYHPPLVSIGCGFVSGATEGQGVGARELNGEARPIEKLTLTDRAGRLRRSGSSALRRVSRVLDAYGQEGRGRGPTRGLRRGGAEELTSPAPPADQAEAVAVQAATKLVARMAERLLQGFETL